MGSYPGRWTCREQLRKDRRKVDFHAGDATAEIGLNNYVYMLKDRQFVRANAHSYRKQGETLAD
ncbi:hypothetical protein CVM73_15615 [Bradyrhizobium forestalis]|uniref:Uncharacterized protein n=1 Tax=Bradyrhizobium forestalis TaxID=1419263 RepID=A0A2M8R8U7_9BRAD|nr:hypothetical protein [Bradyrhizobium forestalis]PJG54243.1 hypothetical protein CVM73_15615 [Bradyrhizobium forestalis]